MEDLFFNNIGVLLLELESIGVLCYEVDLSFNNYIDFVNCYYEDVMIIRFMYLFIYVFMILLCIYYCFLIILINFLLIYFIL